jgi:hypothetical protein
MHAQDLLSAILTPLKPAELVISAMAAIILSRQGSSSSKQGSYESVWDMTNRVCDRYLARIHDTE